VVQNSPDFKLIEQSSYGNYGPNFKISVLFSLLAGNLGPRELFAWDSVHRQRVFLSPILELFSREIATFGRELANSAEVRELFLADTSLRNAHFLCWGESKSGFSPKISPVFEMLLAYR
jgi:hypothetical protein